MATSKLQDLWNHPAGPKTIHFWAPTFKWGISIANIADFAKPPEKLSYPQQFAVAATGIIWSRYSMVITPKNWNLFSVNLAMSGTGLYQLSRKIRGDGHWNYLVSLSVVITPKNWNLFSVNLAMAGTGFYQLSWKIRHDYFNEEETAAIKE